MPENFDREAILTLHDLILKGDRVASARICEAVLGPLLQEVGRRFPHTDEQIIYDGIIDAILEYCENPASYSQSGKVPLDRYLSTASRRNVSNLLKGEQRRKRREKKAGERRSLVVAFDPAARSLEQEDLQRVEERRSAMMETLKEAKDKEILCLWLDGVRDSAAYAVILKIEHLSVPDQRKEVKRQKDRILRFLRRKGLLS